MAIIISSSNKLKPGVIQTIWETVTESDTAAGVIFGSYQPLVGSIQATGTFGGATVTLEGSNDGVNYVTLNDTSGTAIGLTAAGAAEFSTSMAYIRPAFADGSSQDLDVTIVTRY